MALDHGLEPGQYPQTKPSFSLSLHKILQSLCLSTFVGVHGGDGLDEQRGVGLRVLHKHQQELQSCFHHQAKLTGGETCYKTPEIIGKNMHAHIRHHIPAQQSVLCNPSLYEEHI